MKHPELPSFTYRLFKWFCSEHLFEELEGDLEEAFLRNKENYGLNRARSIYTREVMQMIRPSIIKKIANTRQISTLGMFRNNFKIALRNLFKQKEYTIINVLGLSSSLAISMLIILFLMDQDRMDEYNPDADRIYRVLTEYSDEAQDRTLTYATSPYEFEQLVSFNVGEVSEASQIIKGGANIEFDEKIFAFSGLFVSPNFFDFFEYDLLKGDENNALTNSNGIVLSEEFSKKAFGQQDPIGKLVSISDLGTFSITGVVETQSVKSHLNFDILMPKSSYESQEENQQIMTDWESGSRKFYNYFKLKSASNTELISFLSTLKTKFSDEKKSLYSFDLQRLDRINLGRLVGNEIGTTSPGFVSYFFGVLALILMLSSSFNYMNLSVARGLKRAKEVGMRKIIGAGKWQIFFQFLLEAQLIMFVSFALGYLLLQVLVPVFNNMKILRDIDGAITMNFNANVTMYLVFFAFTFIVGIVAGLYPAAYLSSFRPLKVLKGINNSGKRPSFRFRKVLVFFQYSFSIVFIITTIILYQQANIFANIDYGFNHKSIVNLSKSNVPYESFRNELLKRSEIEGVSSISSLPVISQLTEVLVNKKDKEAEEKEIKASILSIDPYAIENLELKLIAGQNFRVGKSMEKETIILNQKALYALGFSSAEESLNQYVDVIEDDEKVTKSRILGVVQDFSYQFVFQESGPLIMNYDPEKLSIININIGSTGVAEASEVIEKVWQKFNNVHQFEYSSYEYTISEISDEFGDLVNIIGLVAFIAILIASLGQFSMIVHHIQLRVKEVGIRKVLGSSSSSLVILLSKDFLLIITLAVLLATPLAWKINVLWTSKIYEGAEVSFLSVVFGLGFIAILAFSTIFILVKKATQANPVDSIGHE